MKKQTVILCDYHEIEELVRKHYNATDYEFVAVQGCGNDSYHKFTGIDGILNKYDCMKADWIRIGQIPNHSNRTVLNCLCADGHIEAGDYIVEVSW